MKHDAANGNSTTIATKISLADKVRLSRIADGFGLSLYELMQGLLMAMARYFDKGSVITYDGNSLLNAIGNVMFATNGSFSPMELKNRQKQHVSKAILFLQRAPGQRPQMVEVHSGTQGSMIESYNYDDMLSAFLGCIDPDGLQRLKDEAKRLGYFSITHALHELIIQRAPTTTADNMRAEVQELFSDVRIVTGEQPNEETHYNRKYNKGDDYTAPTPHKRRIRADL